MHYNDLYHLPSKSREGKVSVLSVGPQGWGGGVPCDHYTWYIGPHCRGTPCPCINLFKLDLTLHGPPLDTFKRVQLGPHCTGIPLWFGPLPVKGPPFGPGPPGAELWCRLKHVRLPSGQYTSCWNAFLLKERFIQCCAVDSL